MKTIPGEKRDLHELLLGTPSSDAIGRGNMMVVGPYECFALNKVYAQ